MALKDDVTIRIGGDAKGAKRAADSVLQSFGRLKGSIASLLGAGAFAALTKRALDNADALSKLSRSTGVGIGALSELNFAAKLSGVDDLGSSLNKLNRTLGDAARGVKEPADAFAALGVEVKDADGNIRGTEDVLLDVADAFSKYEDGAAKSTVAQQLFGRSGAKLITFLDSGREGINALRAEAAALGLTLDESTGKAAEGFNDNLTRLGSVTTGLGTRLASELAPELERLTGLLVETAKDSDAVAGAADGIATAFKSLVLAGTAVSNILQIIGKGLGAQGAALAALLSGDFRGALEIGRLASSDIEGDLDDIASAYEKLFGEIEGGAKDAAEALEAIARPQLQLEDPAAKARAAKAIKAAQDLAAKIAKATRDASDAVFKATQDRDEALLEAGFKDSEITLQDYYARRLGLELAALDQEAAARRAALTGADAAERIRLQGELDAIAIQRKAAAEISALDEARAFTEQREKLSEENLQRIQDEIDRITEAFDRAQQNAANSVATGDLSQPAAQELVTGGATQAIADLQALRAELALLAEQEAPGAQAALDALDESLRGISISAQSGIDKAIASLRLELAALQDNFSGDTVIALRDSFTGLFQSLADGTKKGGEALRDFVRGFAQQMAAIASRALATYLVLQLLDAVYPGLGRTVAASSGVAAGVKHTGGVVGQGGTSRQVPALMFAGAPRFHEGGVPGLKPGELPIIAKRGEEILSDSDPRNVLNGGGAAAQGGGTRVINVIDPNLVQDYMSSSSGEKTLLNVIERNAGAIKQKLG